MKQSVLHVHHQRLHAEFQQVGEWEMPADYGHPVEEHLAVRQAVGMADLSHRGTILVTGDDRVKWLQSILSNDLLPLQPGQGRYSSFMSNKGKILAYVRVYILDDRILVEDVGEVGDATAQTFRKFLLYGTKAKLQSCLEKWGVILVSGPSAASLLQAALGFDLQTLPLLSIVSQSWENESVLIARTEETGEPDYELFMPNAIMPSIWEKLWDAGSTIGLRAFGSTARESLRIEAGLPKLGPDLNELIVPPEANLEGKAFSLNKGCYPGQEVVARMDTYGSVKRRMVGLMFDGKLDSPPAQGSKIFSGDRQVGWVSSAAFSPTLNKTLALGFPLRDFTKPDTELTVAFQEQRHRAVVHPLPFISQNS